MDMLDDEAREQYQELQREVQEDDTYTVSDAEWADVVSGSLTDERLNLDKKIEGVIIAFASVGTWRGPRQGYQILGSNIADILYSQCDDAEWYGDSYNIRGRMIHHDGMNYALYRIAKDRSEAERIADKIYSGEIDEVGFRKSTRDLEIPQPSEGCVAVFCTQIGAILLYQTVCLTLSRRPGYPFIAHTPFPFLSASPCTRFASRFLFCEIDCRLPALSRTAFGWLAENLPPRTKRRVYFPHPPCLARPSIPQAEKQSAFGTGLPEGKKRNLNLYRHERNEQDRRNDGRGGNAPGQEIQIHVAGAAAIGLRVLPRFR